MSLYEHNERVTMKNNYTGEERAATRTVVVRYDPSRGGKAKVVSDSTRLDKKPEWSQVKS